jgi:tetratricopeptide (TPR) repeat protein
MGVVLHAHDLLFERPLALKMLLDNSLPEPESAGRFFAEAQLMGQLQHPGVPPVYDRGTLPDGQPFFAMKLIQGRTLGALLQQRASPAEDLLRFLAIFEQVCQTVAYAHSRGIIHRDLKPHNIMVGAFGEVQVMDSGLAKLLTSGGCEPPDTGEPWGVPPLRPPTGEGRTQAGAILGTPGYLAPEQARGEVAYLDERCDVFGLGAILCVLLTGQPPFANPSALDLLVQTAAGELTDAYRRLDACGAEEALTTLAKRCLAPSIEERPRDASEVAAAVAAYQAQVQERLQQAEVARARMQEERKRRQLRLALAGVVLLLLGGVAAAGWWYQQEQAERALEQAEREAEKARQALRQEQGAGEIKAALREAEQLCQRALTLLDRPESWKATLASAQSAWRRAQALLQQEPPLAATALAQRVEQMRGTLAEQEKDFQLWTAFEQVRFKLYEFDPRYRDREAYQEVRGALTQWGLPLAEIPTSRATALLQQRPRPMQDRLAALLYFCVSRIPDTEKQQRQWLAEVLAAADPDPWRQQLRQAVARAEVALLTRLVDQVDIAQQPPEVLLQVAWEPLLRDHPARVRLLRRAQQKHPGDFWANYDLGGALYQSVFPSGKETRRARGEELAVVSEAVGFQRVAVGLRPGNAPAHLNLGNALQAQGDLAGAIACFKRALDLDPEFTLAHNNLGIALRAQGDLAGAIACYKRTLKLAPELAPAHNNLGTALEAQRDVKGAIACYKKALDLDPKLVKAHNNLGSALLEKKDLAMAMASYQKALELDPKNALARYGAACCAALSAEGKGVDADNLDAKEKTRLRQQALGWLRDILKEYAQQLADADGKTRQAVQQTLHHWQKDPDLASVRGKDALAKLSEAERAAWQQFWAEVETLRQKAAAANSP